QFHLLFDEITEELEEHVDTVAERLTAIGAVAHGTVRAVAASSTISEFPTELAGGLAYVEALAAGLAAVAAHVRASIQEAADLGDADTADVYTEVSRALDKRLWFLEAHLPTD